MPVFDAGTAPAPHHVLHVADADFFIRFGQMLRHIALALNADGLRVSLLTDDPIAAADLDGTPVECHRVQRLSHWLPWRLAGELARRLETPPDVVHVWGLANLRAVEHWTLAHHTPVLAHALSAQDAAQLARLRSRPNLYPLAACRGLLEIGRATARAPGRAWGLLPPVFLLPERVERQVPREHTLGVVCVGRMDERAGLTTLVDAAAQLRGMKFDMQVALIGTGPGAGLVWERMRREQVHDCMTLVHEPRSWDHAMHGVDVCVVPARQDELSLAPLLAMALAKIVLSSRDQLAEWFIEDQTTWQFTPGSAVELAYHLARVVEAGRRARELGATASAYVRAQHAIGGAVRHLIAMYAAAVQGGELPRWRSALVPEGAGP